MPNCHHRLVYNLIIWKSAFLSSRYDEPAAVICLIYLMHCQAEHFQRSVNQTVPFPFKGATLRGVANTIRNTSNRINRVIANTTGEGALTQLLLSEDLIAVLLLHLTATTTGSAFQVSFYPVSSTPFTINLASLFINSKQIQINEIYKSQFNYPILTPK